MLNENVNAFNYEIVVSVSREQHTFMIVNDGKQYGFLGATTREGRLRGAIEWTGDAAATFKWFNDAEWYHYIIDNGYYEDIVSDFLTIAVDKLAELAGEEL